MGSCRATPASYIYKEHFKASGGGDWFKAERCPESSDVAR